MASDLAVELSHLEESSDSIEEEARGRQKLAPKRAMKVLGIMLAMVAAGVVVHTLRPSVALEPVKASPKVTTLGDTSCYAPAVVEITDLKQNNLGGKGPDSGEEGLRIDATTMGKTAQIYFHVTGEGGYKDDDYAKKNALTGTFLGIYVGKDSELDLKVEILVDGEPFVVPKFSVTFFDIDGGEDCEVVTLGPLVEYALANNTQVLVDDSTFATDKSITFMSTEGGGAGPKSKEGMTKEQEERSIQATFEDTDHFNMKFSSRGCGIRKFTFTSGPAIDCGNIQLKKAGAPRRASSAVLSWVLAAAVGVGVAGHA